MGKTLGRGGGEILRFGNPILREKCTAVRHFDGSLHEKIDHMAQTLRLHGGGAALAAPQIALKEQIVVIHYCGRYFELVNPEIQYASGRILDYEGCLSLPDFFGRVERRKFLSVRYRDRFGKEKLVEVKEEMARCFQHEIDHLAGILFIDRMTDEYLLNERTKEKVPLKFVLELMRKGGA